MDNLARLFSSLQTRLRPEDVAELILTLLGDSLTQVETAQLRQAAAGSLKSGLVQMTSMMQEFRQPVAPEKQVAKAGELFVSAPVLDSIDCSDIQQIRQLIEQLSVEIQKAPGSNNFIADRFSRAQRQQAGMDISKRRYNKLFRFLQRFESKLATYQLETQKYQATRMAKSGLAMLIRYEDFASTPDVACFIAWLSARMNRRSVFTNQAQDRAFDQIGQMLLARVEQAPTSAGWYAIAHIMPDRDIVKHLDDRQKLSLFTLYLAQLNELAGLLQLIWQRNTFNRQTMIVKRGDDSSTWNALAGAWNSARQGWLALAVVLGMEEMVEQMCLGKVLRLIAGDVAAWHYQTGGGLEPDTQVWAHLPLPWEVFSGASSCTKADVQRVCAQFGVDPYNKGWIGPRRNRQAVAFVPTPELVHGVVVDKPEIALILRKAGYFSGKGG